VNPALLELRDLRKWFLVKSGIFSRVRNHVKAVDGVSFDVQRGEVLSVVGESGSGKTTVGRLAMRLLEPSGGAIRFDGQDITHLSRAQMRSIRRRMQLVFQDPYASLNPRKPVSSILSDPLEIHDLAATAAERRDKVAEALLLVGLRPEYAARYPHEFSGGQRQRIGIARALISGPDLLVADEPVSALDVSVQAQVVNLLLELKDRLGLTILFIAHDLAVVGHISDRIAVMYLGRVVEIAPTEALFSSPAHPYTEALLSAAPTPDPTLRRRRILLQGDIPSALNPPSGCTFRTRCSYALPACAEAPPPLREIAAGHLKACIRDDLTLRSVL
jgi:oligopeptide/dipeptide ABC transporter ATP-binding protein